MLQNISRDYFKVAGIYALLSNEHGKIYIGSSVNIYVRINSHVRSLQRNIHPNSYLQRFYNKYGPESLEAQCLLIISDKSRAKLQLYEQIYLDSYYDNQKSCFNLSKESRFYCASEEERKKHSERMKKFWDKNRESQLKIVNKNLEKANKVKKQLIAKGVRFPPPNKGKATSEATKKKQSISAKKRGAHASRCRAVIMLDIKGNYIREFYSARNAAKFLTNNPNNSVNILSVCAGRRTTACGYRWKFSGDSFDISFRPFWGSKGKLKAYYCPSFPFVVVKAFNDVAARKPLKKVLKDEFNKEILTKDLKPKRYYEYDLWALPSNEDWCFINDK